MNKAFMVILAAVVFMLVMDIVATLRLRKTDPKLYEKLGSPIPAFGGIAKLRFIYWVLSSSYLKDQTIESRIVFGVYQTAPIVTLSLTVISGLGSLV